MKTLCIEYKNNSIFNNSLTRSYKKEIEKRGGKSFYTDGYDKNEWKRIIDICENEDIKSVIMFLAPNETIPLWYRKKNFAEKGIKLFLYLGDSAEFLYTHNIHIARYFDGIFTTSDYEATRFKEYSIQACAIISSYDRKEYNLYEPGRNIEIDKSLISFIGDTRKADRAKQINYLRSCGIDIKVFKNLTHEQMCMIHAKSYISLNFTKTHFTKAFYEPVYQIKGRPAEVALANGVCLSEYEPTDMRSGSILTSRRIISELDMLKELKELIDNPDERNRRGVEAQRYTLDNLLSRNAVDRMGEFIEKSNIEENKITIKAISRTKNKNQQLRKQLKLIRTLFMPKNYWEFASIILKVLIRPRAFVALLFKFRQFKKNYYNRINILDLRDYDGHISEEEAKSIKKQIASKNKNIWIVISPDRDEVKSVTDDSATYRITCSDIYMRKKLIGRLATWLITYLLSPIKHEDMRWRGKLE